MSDAIGPVNIKERPGSEMQSRIDAEVSLEPSNSMMSVMHFVTNHLSIMRCVWRQVVRLLREAYDRVKALLRKVWLSNSWFSNFVRGLVEENSSFTN